MGAFVGSEGTLGIAVGITLRIRPQIGENGTIRMSIFQESSSLSTLVAPGTLVPFNCH